MSIAYQSVSSTKMMAGTANRTHAGQAGSNTAAKMLAKKTITFGFEMFSAKPFLNACGPVSAAVGPTVSGAGSFAWIQDRTPMYKRYKPPTTWSARYNQTILSIRACKPTKAAMAQIVAATPNPNACRRPVRSECCTDS